MRRLLATISAVLAPCLLAAGCGGGGGGPTGPQTLVVHPSAGRSGYVFEGGTVVDLSNASTPVGDNGGDEGMHAVRSFDFPGVPVGAQILSAVYEDEVTFVDGNPFATMGVLRATLTDVGAALDASDYDGPALAVVLGTLVSGPALGVRTLDLTSFLQTYVDGGSRRLDVMLAFDADTDGDSVADMVRPRAFGSTSPRPSLTIVYQTP